MITSLTDKVACAVATVLDQNGYLKGYSIGPDGFSYEMSDTGKIDPQAIYTLKLSVTNKETGEVAFAGEVDCPYELRNIMAKELIETVGKTLEAEEHMLKELAQDVTAQT